MTKVIEHGDILLVEVPEEVKYNLGISIKNKLVGDTNDSANWEAISIQLPSGNWSILGLVKDLTEEQWRRVVEGFWIYDARNERRGGTNQRLWRYENYIDEQVPFVEALKSGHSLLSKYGLTPSTTLILIKQ